MWWRATRQVSARVDLVHISFLDLFTACSPRLRADGVFLSPPWGGPQYLHSPTYDLSWLQPVDGFELLARARAVSPNVALFLPRNTDLHQLAALAAGEACEVPARLDPWPAGAPGRRLCADAPRTAHGMQPGGVELPQLEAQGADGVLWLLLQAAAALSRVN